MIHHTNTNSNKHNPIGDGGVAVAEGPAVRPGEVADGGGTPTPTSAGVKLLLLLQIVLLIVTYNNKKKDNNNDIMIIIICVSNILYMMVRY